jgi:hypothetical protein
MSVRAHGKGLSFSSSHNGQMVAWWSLPGAGLPRKPPLAVEVVIFVEG